MIKMCAIAVASIEILCFCSGGEKPAYRNSFDDIAPLKAGSTAKCENDRKDKLPV
jgi:hypothetical protein